MSSSQHRAGMFPALLKHWRGQRGLSQLDLALAADVSSRHVSFLETGRSAPSVEMVLRLAATLDVPLRHVNAMLQSAGHAPVYREPTPAEGLPDEIVNALQMMKDHHEPYPVIVLDRTYNVVDLNRGAQTMLGALASGVDLGASPPNLVRLTFDPRLQGRLVNFDEVGRALLWRLQREVLADQHDGALRDILDEALAMPTVSASWRDADLTVPSSPVIVVHLRLGGRDLRFLTMVTALQAPQTVMLDELRIEAWFPTDAATADACRGLARG
jgi:transcriptional regulator with XRE-family HTH domain